MSLLAVSHLRKSFGGAVALADASLDLRAGETHALMGENGAGKSTLIKILAGAVTPDGGDIRLDGAPVTIRDPGEAEKRGLRFIHQELNAVLGVSVAENIFLGRPYPSRFGLIDWRALNARARAALTTLGVEHIAPDVRVAKLSVGDRMLVKIAAAFLEDGGEGKRNAPRIFVLDEPTAALTGRESERLFRIVDVLRSRSCGIIYVSHRLDEVLAISDRVTVLRDGETRATLTTTETTKPQVIELMTGRKAAESGLVPPETQVGSVVLSVRGLTNETLRDVSFDLRKGEILGFAGLADAGLDRLIGSLISRSQSGEVLLEGVPWSDRTPSGAWARGVASAPRERRAEGLVLGQDVVANVALPHLGRLNRWGIFLDRRAERQRAEAMRRQVRLKVVSVRQKVRELSGGNQQKVMFARAVAVAARVLLLDEPTRGVDVGAKFDIYALLRELAAAGAGVVVVSSDQEEILHLCTRVVIMRKGRVFAVLPTHGLTPQRLLTLCYGETAE
jgi:ABC-type sugar transport system ATPase subunit